MPIEKPKSKKQRLRDLLYERRPERITESEWLALERELAPISAAYLRQLLRATGLPVDQPYDGVRQGSFEELERSLVEMGALYAAAVEKDDRLLAKRCRGVVIEAKNHARLAARNPRVDPAKREQKEEMVDWMLVWLGDPSLFPTWVDLKKRAAERASG